MTRHSEAETILKQVIDPDVGVNIVDLGLVLSIEVDADEARVALIMTTPACPQSSHLRDESARLLSKAGFTPTVEIKDTPLWDPSRMTDEARRALGWQP